jgi:hypothetical protein
MKQESNNAIDSMLRKLGRSVSHVSASSGNGAEDSDAVHLDADELNSYAENALPRATRARYTEHLAECARCRHLISQLSHAAGVVFDEAPQSAPANGLKAFLNSLLSPLVLRYAVPALGLLAIASIGFFVLRTTAPTYLAEKRELQSSATQAPVAPTPAPTIASPSINFDKESSKNNKTPQQPEKNEQAKLADEGRRQEKEEPSRGQPVTSTDQAVVAEPAKATSTTAVASSPKPAVADDQKQLAPEVAQSKVEPTPQIHKYESAQANEQPATKRAAKESGGLVFGAAESGLKKGKTDSAARRAPARADAPAEEKERDQADKDEAETTSVAGHRFRKSGSIWVDVSYNSSQPITTMARGSEQYRSLVGDEPAIRTIAEQLQGEVIVVWKGHAYRIR